MSITGAAAASCFPSPAKLQPSGSARLCDLSGNVFWLHFQLEPGNAESRHVVWPQLSAQHLGCHNSLNCFQCLQLLSVQKLINVIPFVFAHHPDCPVS